MAMASVCILQTQTAQMGLLARAATQCSRRSITTVAALCVKQSNHGGPLIARAMASTGEAGAAEDPERDTLVAEFMRYVNATEQSWPLEGRKPTALMPPNTVVKVQMDALMRNDWPEEDSGVKTAFQFSMPAKVDEMLAGQVPESMSAARAWDATERYLGFAEFSVAMRDPMYASIIDCSNWEAASPVIFHGPGDTKALQCVKVTFQTSEGIEACRAYTFCLQKVHKGAYRNCWMVIGVRLGDYANV